MPTLLSAEHFAPIFEPLRGRCLGLVDGEGNVGDRLLYDATRQLLRHFGVQWTTFHPFYDRREDFPDLDGLLLFAGGSMGSNFQPARQIRAAAVATGLPCTILPQSWCSADEPGPWERVFVREQASRKLAPPAAVLVPDLALGYNFPVPPEPDQEFALCLRRNGHAAFTHKRYGKPFDPADWCYSPADYIRFAGHYHHIATDRLHLAITALGLGRRVTLLPVTYHKNRSMWETWLQDLGCEWAERPETVKR